MPQGLGTIPYVTLTDPSQSVYNFNMLIEQINAQLLNNVAVVAGQFAQTSNLASTGTGQLTATTLAAQISILVELRVIANLLNPTGLDLAPMRADELANILPPGSL